MKPRPILLPAFLLLFCLQGFGQDQPTRLLKDYRTLTRALQSYLKSGSIASFDNTASSLLLAQKPDQLEFGFEFEGKTWVLMLEKNNPFSKGFHVISASNNDQPVPYLNEIVHYKGKVKGAGRSVVALTVLPDRIAAVISDASVGNINISSLKNKTNPNSNEHIIYRDTDLLIPNEANCNTKDDSDPHNDFINNYTELAPTSTTVNAEPIDLYFEADYSIYNNNGSNISNVVNYVTTLFNVVNVIFENDSINVRINAIKVWDVADPYVALVSASSVLNLFGQKMWPGFPGDFAHFLSQRSLGGGVAYLNTACSGNSFKTAVSGNLSNSFNIFPAYSWSVEVITHELGHNFGSPHTQNCSWPGGAIDNCYTTEGGCPPGAEPVNGGTIMSYCHLTSYGINFSNGFGPLPGARLRNIMRNNACINPGVYFSTSSFTTYEEYADINNECLPYTIVSAKLTIPYAPSQPANIELVTTGDPSLFIGTNKDIEISPMNFTLDANNLSQTISMKVYDDGLVEPEEKAFLNFNLQSNGGNAVKRNTATNIQVTIANTDFAADQAPNRVIFTEDFESVSTGLGAWTQTVVFGAGSPNRWVIGSNSNSDFPSKAAFVSSNGSTAAYSGFSSADSTIIRLVSPIINTTSFSNLVLTASYKCNGEIGEGGSQGQTPYGIDFGRVLYSLDGGNNWVIAKDNIYLASRQSALNVPLPAPTFNTPQLRIAFEWTNNSSGVNNPPFIVDSIVLKGSGAATVQSAASANNKQQEYLGPYQTIHFYNKYTWNVLASIQNNSSFDFGCTTVELLRTGNESAQAWGQFTDQQISSKLFKITPTNFNNNASYTVKLYFTEAEINGWLTSTGNKIEDLNLAITDQDISTPNPSAQPKFSANLFVNNFGINNDRVITADFTGAGYFALGKVYAPPACINGSNSFTSSVSGSNYQWQVNDGSGYVNVVNNAVYSGVNSPTLQLNNAPTSQYGYKYRCSVTTPFGTIFSSENMLRFESTWLGTVSSAWENPLNWSCGQLPDSNTDVIVNSGTTFTLELNTSVSIRSLRIPSSANILIKAGNTLNIMK